MTPLILAAALAAQPALPALPAPDAPVAWEQLIDEPQGRILLDPASIRRQGDLSRFHVRMIINEGQSDLPFAQAIMAVVVDCRARTFGFEAGRTYDRDGRLTQERESPAGQVEMGPIAGDGAEADYHRRVCPR